MLPRILSQMLTGSAAEDLGRRRRRSHDRIVYQPLPGAVERDADGTIIKRGHDSEGQFVVEDMDEPAAAAAPTLVPVDAAVGQALADELRDLIGAPSAVPPAPR